jgi:hypothetical protein
LDNHQKNLAEFENILKWNRLVPQEKARFYVYWVDRFLKYYQYRPSKPLAQAISSYLKTMETETRFADRQVKQAVDAILLYADKYLKPKASLSSNGSIELKLAGSNNGQNLAGMGELRFPMSWSEVLSTLWTVKRLV